MGSEFTCPKQPGVACEMADWIGNHIGGQFRFPSKEVRLEVTRQILGRTLACGGDSGDCQPPSPQVIDAEIVLINQERKIS